MKLLKCFAHIACVFRQEDDTHMVVHTLVKERCQLYVHATVKNQRIVQVDLRRAVTYVMLVTIHECPINFHFILDCQNL